MDPHYTHSLSQEGENYMHAGGYGTPYASDEDHTYGIVYHHQMQPPYPVVQTGPQRGCRLFSCSTARIPISDPHVFLYYFLQASFPSLKSSKPCITSE